MKRLIFISLAIMSCKRWYPLIEHPCRGVNSKTRFTLRNYPPMHVGDTMYFRDDPCIIEEPDTTWYRLPRGRKKYLKTTSD